MPRPLLLASASAIRLQLLRSAGVDVRAHPARIDEVSMIRSLQAEAASAPDIADCLAETKALKLAGAGHSGLILGCDQVLEFKGEIWSKPATIDDARAQLARLSGQSHHLYSAAVLYDAGQPIWRHTSRAQMTMRPLSEGYIDAYLARNWPAVSTCVGAYQIESEGARLFTETRGDHFVILGLPLLPLLTYLGNRGFIDI